MRLDRDLFQIDSPAAAEKLCSFIREKQIELNRDGILVPFSGGLDSTTVLLLCLRAVGRENLKAVLLPEKQGNPDAQKYAERVARRFEIDTITRDISPVLDRLGVYDYVLAKIPLRPLRELTAKTYMQAADESVFLKLLHGQAAPLERKGFARFNAKHRVRKVIMYLLA
jgi:NAD+ synthase